MPFFFFFFNDTATTEIYTLSLHDALPIYSMFGFQRVGDLIWAFADARGKGFLMGGTAGRTTDRKSTRLNSSHLVISYAVFCLKKKKIKTRKILFLTERVSADSHSGP